MEQVVHHPTTAAVGLATAELILAIQKEFPHVRLVACEPIEGEDIHLWAYLPIQPGERLAVQDRIVEIEHAVQDKYGVHTVVVAMVVSPEVGSTPSGIDPESARQRFLMAAGCGESGDPLSSRRIDEILFKLLQDGLVSGQ